MHHETGRNRFASTDERRFESGPDMVSGWQIHSICIEPGWAEAYLHNGFPRPDSGARFSYYGKIAGMVEEFVVTSKGPGGERS